MRQPFGPILALLCVATCIVAIPDALAREKRFKGFNVTNHDNKELAFAFSETDATSKSPVVISAVGRELKVEDREYRVDLQKHWLSVNVPKTYKIEMRSNDRCDYNVKGGYPHCDHYSFVDPATSERHDYYFYLGNWPHKSD